MDNLRDSLADKMEEYLLQSDGTGNASKDPDGLVNIVAASPTTGTVANINRASYAWWRNQTKASTGAASVYLLSDMRNLMNTCSEGKKRRMPDIIITDQTSAELYDDEVLEQKQIVNQTRGDADFLGVTYKGIPIDWSPQCTAGYMYMLSSSYFGVVSDPDINFTATEWKSIPNQVNDRVMQIAWKGNFVSKRPKSLGVLTGIAA